MDYSKRSKYVLNPKAWEANAALYVSHASLKKFLTEQYLSLLPLVSLKVGDGLDFEKKIGWNIFPFYEVFSHLITHK